MYNPDLHHRKSIRLPDFDYSSEGAYFLTMCLQDRNCLFGEVADGVMTPNDAGKMAEKWWSELPVKFPAVQTDAFVVMPNHLHCIILMAGADLCVRPSLPDPTPENKGGHAGPPLPKIVQWLKTMTTNEYIRNVAGHGWSSFQGRLWQRNYYERIIRNDNELNRFRTYIAENPVRWEEDEENPQKR